MFASQSRETLRPSKQKNSLWKRERIVEAYARYIKGWATTPNTKCAGQREIDLFAIDRVTTIVEGCDARFYSLFSRVMKVAHDRRQ
jgi:hypothetical protein